MIESLASSSDVMARAVFAYEWDFSAVWNALPTLLEGARLTVVLAGVVMMLALPLGFLVALLRLAPFKPINLLAYVYTELFRSLPLLVLIIWFHWVMPVRFGWNLSTVELATIALTLNVSAFVAEIIRGGILSVDRGQREAAISTGMTELTTLRRVVLPQALRRSIPLLAAIWISLFKDTSLVAVIGVQELMFEARKLAVDTYRPMETLTIAALMYFAMTYPQALVLNRLFDRFRVKE